MNSQVHPVTGWYISPLRNRTLQNDILLLPVRPPSSAVRWSSGYDKKHDLVNQNSEYSWPTSWWYLKFLSFVRIYVNLNYWSTNGTTFSWNQTFTIGYHNINLSILKLTFSFTVVFVVLSLLQGAATTMEEARGGIILLYRDFTKLQEQLIFNYRR